MIIDHPSNTPAAWSARASAYVEPWLACGWSEVSQKARFAAVLAATGPRPHESVLDYGCGTGGFADWLPSDVEYVGYDSSLGMIDRARVEHPGRWFQGWEPVRRFDVSVALGVFNLPAPGGKQGTFHSLRCLWERTRRVMAVSLYAGKDRNCVRYTEADCRGLLGESWRASITRWRENDLLVVLER